MNRWSRIVCSVIAVSGMCVPAIAGDAPTPGTKAGSVTALLPVAHVSRVVNKANVVKDAAKGDDVYWNDVVRTEKGGRARITLNDQSILSLGSQAELHVIKHDAKTQQTQLELTYGRVRAEVTTVTKDGGSFEVKTPTAVAGVIGTTFGAESTVGESKFLCMAGMVNVRSADPAVPGVTSCEPGKVITIGAGKAPVKRNATPEEYQKWYADTETAVITGMWPWALVPGAAVDAKATGNHLDGVTSVSSSDSSIAVTLKPSTAANSVGLHVAVSATTKPGAYIFTFKKTGGSEASTVFLVLGTPGSMDDIDSMLNDYLETIEEERHAALAALNAVQLQLQQSADMANGALTAANTNAKPPLDLTKTSADIQNNASNLQANLADAQSKVNAAFDAAKKDFTNRFNTAVAALKTRNASGKPDDEFRSSVSAAFSDVNATANSAVASLVDALQDQATQLAALIAELEQQEMALIAANTPANTIPAQAVEQAYAATFAAGPLASGGGPYKWEVCDGAYKSTSAGKAIPAGAPGCNALPGYVSATPSFTVDTCDLKPASYVVRFTNGDKAYESTLGIIKPAYDDPLTRLQGMAQAYDALLPDIFMEYFDPVNFPGYSQLSENIRRTMQSLTSMNIHLIVDDIAVNCNEASVRAEWQENYSFPQSPKNIQKTTGEEINVKFLRTPGKGWYITELNGDNGTVQGIPPGPVLTDAPTAQLTVLNVNVAISPTSGTVRRAAASAVPTVPLGPVSFTATVSNTGKADVTLPVAVQFFLLDDKGTQLDLQNSTLPPPLKAGTSADINQVLTIPSSVPGGAVLTIGVRVNPNCTIPVQRCDSSNLTKLQVEVGAVDMSPTKIAAVSPLVGTVAGEVRVTVSNLGKQASPATTGNLVLTSPLFSGSVKADIPAIPAGGAVNVDIHTPALPNVSGSQNFTATITPPVTGDIDTGDKTITSALPVATAVDIAILSVTPTGSLVGTSNATFNVQLKNLGAATSVGNDGDLALTEGTGTPVALGAGDIPNIAPGATATVAISVALPNISGSTTFTAHIATPITFDTNAANDTLAVSIPVTTGVDIQVVSITPTGGLVGTSPATFNVVLKNLGGATSAAVASDLTVSDTSGAAILLGTSDIPSIGPGASVTVPVTTTLPNISGTTKFTAQIVTPIPGDTDSANDTLTVSLPVGAGVDIQVAAISSSSSLVESQAGTINVTLKNLGGSASTATTGNLILTGPSGPALATGDIPSIAAGSSTVVSLAITVPALSGATNFTAKISPAVPNDGNPANDTLTQSLTIQPAVDIQVVSITGSGLVEGQPATLSVTLKNLGAGTSAATTGNLKLSGPSGSLGTASIPAIGPGASTTIPIAVTLPVATGATSFTATISPAVPLDTDSANDTLTTSLTLATAVDIQVVSLTNGSVITENQPSTFTVTLKNNGAVASSATTGNLLLSGPSGPALGSANIPSIAAGTSITVPITVTIPTLTGANNFTAAISPAVPLDLNAANDSLTVSFTVLSSYVDLKMTGLSVYGGGSLSSGNAYVLTISVQNNGNLASGTGDTLSCGITGPGFSGTVPLTLSTTALVSLAPGGTTMTSPSFTMPKNLAGSDTITCTASEDPNEPSGLVADNTRTFGVTVNTNLNLHFSGTLTPPAALQMGSSATLSVTVTNDGPDDAPAASYSLQAGMATFSNIGTLTGTNIVAIPATTSHTYALPITVPQLGTAPQDVSNVTGQVNIIDGTGLTETNTTDNVITTTSFRVLDFTLTTSATTMLAVTGRTLNGQAYVVAPTTYIGLFPSFAVTPTGVPTGITVNKSGGMTGTVTAAAGNYSATFSGSSAGVTHAASAALPFTVHGEINFSLTSAINLTQTGTGVVLAGTLNGGLPTIAVSTPAPPTGITIAGPASINVGAVPATINAWTLSADATSTLGAASINLTATDSGVTNAFEAVPGNTVTLPVAYTVGGLSNFVIQSATFVGHGAGPNYEGAQALQVGEAAQMQVVVKNIGDADPPAGATVTVNIVCSASPICNLGGTSTAVAAPLKGATATLTFSVGTVSDAAATGYPGTVTVTPTGATELNSGDNTLAMSWDVVDFAVVAPASNPTYPTQNMPLSKTSFVYYQLTEAGGTTAFAIPVAVTSSVTGVTLPGTVNVSPGTDQQANIAVSASTSSPNGTLVFTGTNHGVKRTYSQPVDYYTAAIVSTTLFSNSSAQPLTIPLNNSSGATVEFQIRGNFNNAGTSGAPLTLVNPIGTAITFHSGTTVVSAGDNFGVIVADPATTTIAPPRNFDIQAAIPATIPQDTPTYSLWVTTVGTSNLAVSSVAVHNTAISIDSKQPWLAGETIAFDFTVTNNGSAASLGGETLQAFFNNTAVASTGVPNATGTVPALGPGASTTITVNLTAPDAALAATSTLSASVVQDPPNKANPVFTSAPLDSSDWGIFLIRSGGSDASPLQIIFTPGAGYFGQSPFQLRIPSYGGSVFRNGAPNVSSTAIDPNITQSIAQTSGAISGNVNETLRNTAATSDFYYGQVSATYGNVTRSATVHIQWAGGGAAGAVSLTSPANNISPSTGTPPTTIQINGYVAESEAITGNNGASCTPSGTTTCQFVLTFTPDASATSYGSNGLGAVMTYGTATTYQFTANINPANGVLTTGSGNIVASVTGAQPTSAAKRAGAVKSNSDPIGTQQFNVAFNVGDINVTFPSCVAVPPGTSLTVPLTWAPTGGFNAPQVLYEWFDQNLNPLPSSVITPGTATVSPSGTINFKVTNSSGGTNTTGLTYYFGIELFNSQGQVGVQPKYIPVTFDLTSTGGYCPATSPTGTVRGGGTAKPVAYASAPTLITGFYGKSHAGDYASKASAAKKTLALLPDVQLSAKDVTFSPSLPKSGDTLDVRFRLNNTGAVDAKQVPLALVVNGVTVSSDTFDLKAGASSLGALHWNLGKQPVPANKASGNTTAQLVVDPQHTVPQASTVNKTAMLSHLVLPGTGPGVVISPTGSSSKIAHFEVSDGGCAGLRFAGGAGGCGSADAEITISDLAAGKYVLSGRNGIADLGVGRTDASNASFGSEVAIVAGHTYAVQLSGKSVGLFTVQKIRNPKQLSIKSDKVFNRGVKVPVGKGSGAATTGDVSGGAAKKSDAFVYFDVAYSVQ
ncbi:hypothetical protein Acid345_1345 [Candidatus Koribacter versatilis Ellin345]|uniref:FecR protein domain-containing protein n=1 Tax=Koribacter versatilis (strain Ellin345) TaxID=204669 RepID=Q1IS03_KORVE|nr:CARDB domain-containing protein [Candidatus Koribacter versatilis]ABF40347.1 hypothetical protein Acid345_1345 [Candidatus Koribacter versatilis Ellin345]